MADLTADAPLRIYGQAYMHQFVLDTSAARTVYKGQPLIIDQSVDAVGNVVPYTDALAVTTTDVFMGIAAEGKTIPQGAAEDIRNAGIEAFIGPTILGFRSSLFTNGADNGKAVTMSDSGTLSTTTLGNPKIGTLQWVEDGYAYVKLETNIVTGAGA